MCQKVVVLLDGGFVRVQLRRRLKRPVRAEDVLALVQRLTASSHLRDTHLLRTYFYDAPPLRGTLTHPIDGTRHDFSRQSLPRENQELLDRLALQENFAVRRGELHCVGWRLAPDFLEVRREGPRILTADDVVPDIRQKGVDLRIGLDLAWIALRRLADVMVLATGDSDFVPALRFARREGLRMHLETLGYGVSSRLREHADVVTSTLPDQSAERRPPHA